MRKRVLHMSKDDSNQIRFQREVIREEYVPTTIKDRSINNNELQYSTPLNKNSKK